MERVGIFLAGCSLVVLLSVDVSADIGKCVAITNPSNRLKCYDKQAKSLPSKSISTYIRVKTSTDTHWRLITEKSASGSGKNLYLRVLSKQMWIKTDEDLDVSHLKNSRPSLSFQCVNGELAGNIDWGFILNPYRATIIFRFDNEKIQKEYVRVTEDYKGIKSVSKEKLIARIKVMFGKKKAVGHITPKGSKPIQVTFDISGLESAIRPLREECNW